jgi:hypothetical protein
LTANKSLDREVRTSALLRLEKNLKTTRASGDTRPNVLFAEIKIHPDTVSYSDSDMDRGADFVSLTVTQMFYSKPHLGVRAELYRNPVKADAEAQSAFEK